MAEYDTEKLIVDLRACRELALAAIADMDDGGTCNFDSPVIRGITAIQADALRVAGFSNFEWELFGRPAGYVIGINVGGIGATRTKGAEVFEKALRALGYETALYYQVD